MTSKLTVQLEGGCGNQLFQFFAGLYLAQKTGKHLYVDIRQIKNNRHAGHGIFDKRYFNDLDQVNFISEAERGKFRKKSRKLLGKDFRAHGVGFPRNFASMSKAELITGYFQTYFFIDKLIKNGSVDVAELRSNLFIESKSRILRNIDFANSAVIHVRGGDYLAQKETIGVLSTAYYSAVSRRLPTELTTTYIVSDETEEVISKRIGSSFHYQYIDTSKLHPLEVIGLISQFGNIGISNSTLSWWGAYLQKSGRVIAPTEWFRTLEPPNLLMPPDWALESTVWEE